MLISFRTLFFLTPFYLGVLCLCGWSQTRPQKPKNPTKPVTEPAESNNAAVEHNIKIYSAAQDAHQRGDLQTAITLYRSVLQNDPLLWQALFQLASAQFSLHKYNDAEHSILKLVEDLKDEEKTETLKPYLSKAYVLLGKIGLYANDLEGANKAFLQALTFNAKNVSANLGLAKVLFLKTDYASARNLVAQVIDTGDQSLDILVLYAEILIKLGSTSEALTHLSKSIFLYPKSSELLRLRASLSLQSRDVEGAIQDIKLSLTLEDKLDDRLFLGELYTRTKRFDEALDVYKGILKEDPDNTKALTALTIMQVESGKSLEAIASLENLIKSEPSRADLRAQLASLYLISAPEKALEEYQAAAKLKPGNLSYELGVGSALVKLKRYAEAVLVLRKVIGQNPEGEVAYVSHTNLATALFELDDYANAANEFLWILKQQKDSQRAAVTLYFLGICFDKSGDFEQAKKAYTQFLSIASSENQLEIDKVKLRMPSLLRQLEKGQGKRKQ